MTPQDLLRLVRECLGNDLIQEKGRVLYSRIGTLAPNEIYVLGFNPGGNGRQPISEEIMGQKPTHFSAFDEPWAKHNYGKRTKGLLKCMRYDYHDVFITNAFFSAGPSIPKLRPITPEKEHSYQCVHYKLLSIVRPNLVICLGNGREDSAFHYFQKWATNLSEEMGDVRDGKFCRATYPDIGQVWLFGTPHFSHYPLTKELCDRLNNLRKDDSEKTGR